MTGWPTKEPFHFDYMNTIVQIASVIIAVTVLISGYMLKTQMDDMTQLRVEISKFQTENQKFVKSALSRQQFVVYLSEFEMKIGLNISNLHAELKITDQNVSDIKEKLLDMEESISILVLEGRKFPSQFQNLTEELINVSKVIANFSDKLIILEKAQENIKESIKAIEKIYESSVDNTQAYGQIFKL